MVQNFREIAENHINVNFRDKNFVIATFFRDYPRARGRRGHVVAPCRTRGVGLEVCIKCVKRETN